MHSQIIKVIINKINLLLIRSGISFNIIYLIFKDILSNLESVEMRSQIETS